MTTIQHTEDHRRVFIDTLCELAEHDERIIFIVPDVGFNYAETFSQRFPKRYFNFGTTETSTITIASAMALSGLRPFVYSMINFVAFRPFEMVRNAIVLHRAPVVLLGVKGSSAYRFLGFSHNLVERLAFPKGEDIYHLEPYMRCYSPSGRNEVREDVLESYKCEEPSYIRL